ncbi:DUF4145 domain-containing protein [Shewanella hafniensis]|uniref:DUF4145 domain-containing protein n=2 Tax=Shewanella hafniensis TaxID=365590 RepID=UPI00200D2FCC|nr:DUF4145 domain-containing protein [Shewanella hafniensis]MCL1136792.1 DUF4145 domain-containing protein [Shewanella hafniensis]
MADAYYECVKFKCLHSDCGVLATQEWCNQNDLKSELVNELFVLFGGRKIKMNNNEINCVEHFLVNVVDDFAEAIKSFFPENISFAKCCACEKYSIWYNSEAIYPLANHIEPPSKDLPSDVMKIYNEAVSVFKLSPKSAAALLRLALQKLLNHLGLSGDINEMIKQKVSDGVGKKIQQAMDLVRYIGNQAVHPGMIDFDDDKDIAFLLFRLINIIAKELITIPSEIDSLFENIIPVKLKDSIAKRDNK